VRCLRGEVFCGPVPVDEDSGAESVGSAISSDFDNTAGSGSLLLAGVAGGMLIGRGGGRSCNAGAGVRCLRGEVFCGPVPVGNLLL
jgi:hypothetical protein